MKKPYRDKAVLVVDRGLFVSWALRLSREFGEVYYHNPDWKAFNPRTHELRVGHGFEEITMVRDFWSIVPRIDLFCFPYLFDGDLQLELVRQGKRVWGAHNGDQLENFRAETKEEMRKLGMPVNDYAVIEGISNLRSYLQKHRNVYVKIPLTRSDTESFHAPSYEEIIPKLREIEHKLDEAAEEMQFVVEQPIEPALEIGYDGFTIDGQFPAFAVNGVEVKNCSYVGAFLPYDSLDEHVRQVNQWLSPALKDYGYRGLLSTEVRVGPDEKPYLIDLTCFSDDTEILTDSGWKKFQDLDRTEKVATLNETTGCVEYQLPTHYQSVPFSGEMVRVTNRKHTIDLLVTPDHLLYLKDRDKKKSFVCRADSVSSKVFIPRTAKWEGVDTPFFTVPGYSNTWYSGRNMSTTRTVEQPPMDVPMEDWLRFLAIYLSDGSCSKYYVTVSQFDRIELYQSIISALPFPWSKLPTGFQISSMSLHQYLKQFGVCDQKFIPDYVKALTPKLIRIFLDTYLMADGHGDIAEKVYYTTSRRLADDLQELIFKAGGVANIYVTPAKGTVAHFPNGSSYVRNHDRIVISEQTKNTDFYLEGWGSCRASLYLSRVQYSGMVYDVTIPNHLIYVRRNGRPAWSSNCRGGSPPSESIQELITNWGEIMWMGAEGIMTEPEPAAKYCAQAVIYSEFSRTGWQPVTYPDEIRDKVKLFFHSRIKGKDYVVPQGDHCAEIGWVIGLGDTVKDAIQDCRDNAEQVGGYNVEVRVEGLDKAVEAIREGERMGIQFSDEPIKS